MFLKTMGVLSTIQLRVWEFCPWGFYPRGFLSVPQHKYMYVSSQNSGRPENNFEIIMVPAYHVKFVLCMWRDGFYEFLQLTLAKQHFILVHTESICRQQSKC